MAVAEVLRVADDGTLVVTCPWCLRLHRHGTAAGGHRLAHCGLGGYDLANATTAPETPGADTEEMPTRPGDANTEGVRTRTHKEREP